MSRFEETVKGYEEMVRNLIQVLQDQVLAMVKLHGIDRTWARQFSELVKYMQTFEAHIENKMNFSIGCKELHCFLSRSLGGGNSNRYRTISLESALRKKNQSINSRTSTTATQSQNSPGKKKPVTSTYYSKIMNKFLSTHKSPKPEQKSPENQSIWVLGDEVKFLL